MAKHLDEKSIMNELRGGSAFFQPSPAPTTETVPQRAAVAKKKKNAHRKTSVQRNQPQTGVTGKSSDRPVDQPANRSTEQLGNPPDGTSFDQQDSQSIEPLADRAIMNTFDISPVLPRPKSFYITEKQDEDLDILVKKISERVKGRAVQKVDRSVTTRLILESADLTSDDTADRLAKQLTSRLASQLAGQLEH